MHTSVAELREASDRLEISIRVFPDDMDSAVPGAATPDGDSALASYVLRVFSITGRDGRFMPLQWKGAIRQGDVLLLRLEAPAETALAGAMVSHALLLDRFPDQVNVVRATYEGRTATLLFLPGDVAKKLP
jgi:hypothetical protein